LSDGGKEGFGGIAAIVVGLIIIGAIFGDDEQENRDLPLEEVLSGYIGPLCQTEHGAFDEEAKDYDAYTACAIRDGPGTEHAEMGATAAGQRYDVEGFEYSADYRRWMRIKWADNGEISPRQEWYDEWRRAKEHRRDVWVTVAVAAGGVLILLVGLILLRRPLINAYRRRTEKSQGRARGHAREQGRGTGTGQAGHQRQKKATTETDADEEEKEEAPRPPPPKDRRARALEILGLTSPAADPAVIKKAYRLRAQMYHSDRFQASGDDELVRLAEEKMKDLNWARDFLMADLRGR